ncbi:MAG: LPS export ABC transporter periplasmic protein LptC [Rhodothermia bacterium]|nr:LPS export ABC transporter periplasmic protein LptC [Rhodothermia bacterium]
MRRVLLQAILLLSAVCLSARGQDRGEEGPGGTKRVNLSADTLAGVDQGGTAVQMLIGNVRLRQEETRLRADRATQYPDRDEILFEGNVVVFERGDTLSASRLLYNRTTKISRASGSVRLTDGDVVVTAPSAVYDTRNKQTDFREGVTLVDTASVLVSDTGTYWSESKRAAFAGNVRLETEDASVVADSVEYEREAEVSRARGNVVVYSVETALDSLSADTTSATAVVANWAFNDRRAGKERLGGNVFLFQARFDSTDVDTLLMQSESLRIEKSDTLNRMWSTGGVRIWNMDTSALADSVLYETRTGGGIRRETIHLFVDPVSWFQSSQIYGDTLRIASTGGEPDSLVVRGHTFLAESDSLLARIHQVKGRDLAGRFLGAGRRRMIVAPNAEALYFLKDGEVPNGAVRTTADRIVFEFVDDSLRHVRAEGGVEGSYFPEDQLADQKLEGFRWMEDRRPRKAELLAEPRLVRALDESPFRGLAPGGRRAATGAPAREPPPIASARNSQSDPKPSEEMRAEQDDPPSHTEAPALRDDAQTLSEGENGETAWKPGTVDKTRDGYTLVVASRADRSEAERLAAEWHREVSRDGLDVDLFAALVDGTTYYRIGVGRFNTRAGARRVLTGLGAQLPEQTWILRITRSM